MRVADIILQGALQTKRLPMRSIAITLIATFTIYASSMILIINESLFSEAREINLRNYNGEIILQNQSYKDKPLTRNFFVISNSSLSDITSKHNLAGQSKYIIGSAVLIAGQNFAGATIVGVDAISEKDKKSYISQNIVNGDFSLQSGRNSLVVSSSLAKLLNITIDSHLELYAINSDGEYTKTDLILKGIFEDKGSNYHRHVIVDVDFLRSTFELPEDSYTKLTYRSSIESEKALESTIERVQTSILAADKPSQKIAVYSFDQLNSNFADSTVKTKTTNILLLRLLIIFICVLMIGIWVIKLIDSSDDIAYQVALGASQNFIKLSLFAEVMSLVTISVIASMALTIATYYYFKVSGIVMTDTLGILIPETFSSFIETGHRIQPSINVVEIVGQIAYIYLLVGVMSIFLMFLAGRIEARVQ